MESLIQERVATFNNPRQRIGATYVEGEGVHIRLWAPKLDDVKIIWNDGQAVKLDKSDRGYYTGLFPNARPGDKYLFESSGKNFPDPASRFQPDGPHGPSQVLAENFKWTDDDWQGIPFEKWVIYEIHPGTYSASGKFSAIQTDLPRLKELGVTTLEIMPVSQFSGHRNWGYDGVFPHAVQNSYGGPDELKSLVNAAHAHGLSIILDCVYNHIGPEGNVLFQCGDYTTGKYSTPWGDALNYDGEGSEEVRLYFLQSVWQWLTEYHFDGLRLDAIQMIFDTSPFTFLEEITRLKIEAEKLVGRKLIVTGESDMNDPGVLTPLNKNGLGLDGQWADDFHHCLHVTLTGENKGYYHDYGGLGQLAAIYRNGVAFTGQYSPFHGRRHGRAYDAIPRNRLIVEVQNHDQIGNRAFGERMTSLVDFEKQKLAAACIFLSPFTPFLFMGEEFASEKPFLYFVSHSDKELNDAISKGRAEEWKSFEWADMPLDPAEQATFENCILDVAAESATEKGRLVGSFYKSLIEISKTIRKFDLEVEHQDKDDHIILTYSNQNEVIKVVLSFHSEAITAPVAGNWQCILNSADYIVGNPVPQSFASDKLEPFSAMVFKQA